VTATRREWGGLIGSGKDWRPYYKVMLDLPYDTKAAELPELMAANDIPGTAVLEPYEDYGDKGVRLAWYVPVPQEDLDAEQERLEQFQRDHPRKEQA
jgi:hypothetical protein